MKGGVLAGYLLMVIAVPAAAQAATGDPLGAVRRVAGRTIVQCSGALETLMLLAQLASNVTSAEPASSEFQAQARARFGLRSSHPAVQETAALMERGFGYRELAWLSTLMTPAPSFVLVESGELKELAALLPGGNVSFNLDRLLGYAKLVREFYWDNHVGQFLRSSAPYYQQIVRRALPPDVPADVKVLVSPLAPAERIEFTRRAPRLVKYLVVRG